MKINKDDFLSPDEIENLFEQIANEAEELAHTALADGMRRAFADAHNAASTDREYINEVVSSTAGVVASSVGLQTEYLLSKSVPIILELAYQNAVELIEKQNED